MDRRFNARLNRVMGFPYARGDGPDKRGGFGQADTFSLRTWGWTVGICESSGFYLVFPTHVGMDRICCHRRTS
jgi:hypothetical protein